METFFFAIVALVAIVSGILVVKCRNPINSALSLIMTFFSLATLYVMLDAPFMAAIQVIVYAGAIMVLIVFVIMLLNIRLESRKPESHRQQRVDRRSDGAECRAHRADRQGVVHRLSAPLRDHLDSAAGGY